jgi:hypothetical protein
VLNVLAYTAVVIFKEEMATAMFTKNISALKIATAVFARFMLEGFRYPSCKETVLYCRVVFTTICTTHSKLF